MANEKTILTVKKLIRLIIVIIIVAGLISVLRSTNRPREVSAESEYRQVMGTFARIVAVAADKKTAEASIEAAFDKLKAVDAMMSGYDQASL